MLKRTGRLTDAAGEAWDMLIDLAFPLPHSNGRCSGAAVAAMIPVLGLLLGCCAAFCGKLGHTVFNPWAGALLFSAAALFVLDFKDSGRGILSLTGFFLRLSRSRYACAAPQLLDHPVPVALLSGIVLLKLVIFIGMAVCNSMGFLAVVAAGGFTLQGFLALQGSSPQLRGGADARKALFWSAGLIGVCCCFFFPAGTLAAAGVFYLAQREMRRIFRDWTPEVISFCGAFLEVLLLVTGVFFAL